MFVLSVLRASIFSFFFFNDTATTEIYTLSLHDALPIWGKLLVFLDADDLYPPGYLARFSDAAAAAPEAEVFHCGMRAVDFDGRFLYGHDSPLPLDHDPLHALAGGGAPHIAALAVRSTTAARVGPFNQRLEPQGDWDYWLRLAGAGAAFRAVPGNFALGRRPRDRDTGKTARRGAAI